MVHGLLYMPKFVYVLDISDEDVPIFAIVNDLILCDDVVVLVCFYLKPLYYCVNKHSYVVQVTDKLLFLKPGHELNIHPLDMYELESKNYIRLRYKLYPHN